MGKGGNTMGDLRATSEELRTIIEQLIAAGERKMAEELSAYMDRVLPPQVPEGEEGQVYQLKLYDEVLLTFWLSVGRFGEARCTLDQVSADARDRLPLDLELSGEGVMRWLRKRVIPKNRAFVDEILGTFGLDRNNVKGIIDVCKGLSLNDSYWVVPAGSAGTFSQYNLYENRFSEALALVAYTGVARRTRPLPLPRS